MSTTKTNKAFDKSIFKCSSELEKKGYMYTDDGLYCPLADDKYLKIARNDDKYSYSLVEYKNSTFNYISSAYSCKEAITEEKPVLDMPVEEGTREEKETRIAFAPLSLY